MTKKEMELRIKNLEETVSILASRQSNRDNDNETKISNVKSEADTGINDNTLALEDLASITSDHDAAILELAEIIGGN